MRIASLVPSATELLFALGLGDRVAAVTHECDYPPGAEQLPHLTRSVIPAHLDAGEIDRAVRERTGRGEALYELDEELLEELEVDLIVTQAVCEVCAVSYDDVTALAERLPTRPEVISLDPSTLGEVLADVPRLADAAGVPEAGARLVEEAGARLAAVEQAVEGAPRPRVAALEWLDPVYVGGHWVPQMIELAGGEDVLGLPGREVAHGRVGRARGERAGARDLDAVRPLRRGGRGGDPALAPPPRAARRARGARWTRPPTSRVRARAWWTAWSCSATCCTPSSCRRRRRGARSRSTSSARRPPRADPVARTVLFLHSSCRALRSRPPAARDRGGLERTRFDAVAVLPEQGPLAGLLEKAGVKVELQPLALLDPSARRRWRRRDRRPRRARPHGARPHRPSATAPR